MGEEERNRERDYPINNPAGKLKRHIADNQTRTHPVCTLSKLVAAAESSWVESHCNSTAIAKIVRRLR